MVSINTNLLEIIFLLDRSGSMSGLENDTISGFNSFVKKQSEIGETLITTVLFDNKYEILHNGVRAQDVNLTKKEYFVGGTTSLLDAIGKTIIDVGTRLSNTDEEDRPGKVIFVITTDGYENSSKEFDYEKINEMITCQKEKYNWDFIFLGANLDISVESKRLGIENNKAFSYEASSSGTERMYDLADRAVFSIRECMKK